MKIPRSTTVAAVAALVLLVMLTIAAYKIIQNITTYAPERDMAVVKNAAMRLGAGEICKIKGGIGTSVENLGPPDVTVYMRAPKLLRDFNADYRDALKDAGLTVLDNSTAKISLKDVKPSVQIIAKDEAKKTTVYIKLYQDAEVSAQCELVKADGAIKTSASLPFQRSTTIYLYAQHQP